MNTQMMFWNLTLLGQVAADGAAGTETKGFSVSTIWEFAVKGGPMMIPIALCSLAAGTVILERLISLRRSNIIPAGFMPGLTKTLGEDGDNRSAALEYCKKDGSPVAKIFSAGVKRLGESVDVLEKYMQEACQREVLKMRKYFRLLAIVGTIAPMMGLLGTMFGMMVAFHTVANSGDALGKAELLAKGIYQAMITTAGGLMLAIPVLVVYAYLSAKIHNLVSQIDLMTVDFIEQYAEAHQDAFGSGPKLVATKSPRDIEDDDDEVDAKLTASASA